MQLFNYTRSINQDDALRIILPMIRMPNIVLLINIILIATIAGSSLILKLCDQVVLLLWGHLLHSDPLQFGYKAGYGTTHCSWFVMETASYLIRRKTPVIVTLLANAD